MMKEQKRKNIRGHVNKIEEVSKDIFSSFGLFTAFFSPLVASTEPLQGSGEN